MEFKDVTTKGGDKGESSLYSGERLRKDDIIFKTLGDFDELNCHIGMVKLNIKKQHDEFGTIDNHFHIVENLDIIQKMIMKISSMIATEPDSKIYDLLQHFCPADLDILEENQMLFMECVTFSKAFIVPGDTTELSCMIDLARTVTRRCERRMVTLIKAQHMQHLKESMVYINRLSDYLFIVARYYD